LSISSLGRLQRVDLRTCWMSESGGFTPWLAQEQNLELLGEATGIDLDIESVEQPVGPYRADIVCRDKESRGYVLVENQLEATDHQHLGQIFTYAAGLDAVTIVWIAARFTDEHRAALDWLNQITNSDVSFFGLEIELWRIGDSPFAPKFNIVSQPNEWSKRPSCALQAEHSATQLLQLAYWEAFNKLLSSRRGPLSPRQTRPENWMDYSLGRYQFWLSAVINCRDSWISASLVIAAAPHQEYYSQLLQVRREIEAEVKAELEWHERPELKTSRVERYLRDADPSDRDDWPRQHAWLVDTLEGFHRAFANRVRSLDVNDAGET